MDEKKEWKIFLLTDYEEEENYLRKMAKEGWKLTRFSWPYIYHFEKSEPQDMVYRLDLHPDAESDSEYQKLYEDYGWEYVMDVNDYQYFRKAAENNTADDLNLFSDNGSRLDMMKKVFRTKMTTHIFVFVILTYALYTVYTLPYKEDMGPVWYVFVILYIALTAWYVYVLIHCAIGIRRLTAKYHE